MITAITFGVCISSAQPISGGCLNPAIGLSLCLVNLFDNWKGYTVEWVWLYLIFPLLGAALGAKIFNSEFSKGTTGVGPGGETAPSNNKSEGVDGNTEAVGGEFLGHIFKSFG